MTNELQFEDSTDVVATEAEATMLLDGLREFNLAQTRDDRFQFYRAFARDAGRRLIGGLLAEAHYGWLRISTIWVEERHRRRGCGTRLVEMAETFARHHGCNSAWLDTFSFQAKPFYERLGYSVVATLPDYPTEHERYILVKRLV